jgi:DNA-binding cell septation regulator SpoVG
MSGLAPNASTAAVWGDRPPARRVKIRKWAPYRSGAALGFIDVELPSGMIFIGLRLMTGKRGPWVAMPAQRQLGREGNPRRDANGKAIFSQIIKFRNRATANKFAAALLEALRRECPDALSGDGEC